ncbi:MAG: hypothetical protein KC897_11140 [Candidatus Omnitrophica bacterium]|nr:hypothetical protein [Candidatus Omnitrophota bacterium]MCB9721979.1 hypothetical protein [Candidatus Omnitrophota bacterium]
MYIPLSLSVIIQIICAVHAYKTGRYFWIWIILFFSLIGCAVYFFIEVMPELQPAANRAASGATDAIAPQHKINKLKEQLEISDTLENRISLGDAYIGRKQFDEAIAVMEPYRHKPQGDDPELVEKLALAHFSKKDYEQTRELLKDAKNSLGKYENQRVHLLYTLSLQRLGDTDGALREYEKLMEYALGEEARCRYALLLKEIGRDEEADKIFRDIIQKCKISPPFYRREHKTWLEAAQKAVTNPAT